MCTHIRRVLGNLCRELADFEHQLTEPVMQRKFGRVYKAIVEEAELDLLRIVEESRAYVKQDNHESL